MTTSPENIKESKIVSAVTRALRISSETPGPLRMGSTPGWDSMGHMSVVMELEKEFNVRFPPYALPQLVDVPSIMKMLQGSV